MASGGTATFSPTASISPLRTTAVPLLMTEPETVTIFALWMATAGWDWAEARAQHRNSAVTRFFIIAIGLYGVNTAPVVTRRGAPLWPAFYAVYWDLSTRKPVRYRDAGVNIDEADRAVSSIKKFAKQTFTPGVLTEIGSFGAMYQLAGYRRPVLGDPTS